MLQVKSNSWKIRIINVLSKALHITNLTYFKNSITWMVKYVFEFCEVKEVVEISMLFFSLGRGRVQRSICTCTFDCNNSLRLHQNIDAIFQPTLTNR